MIRYRIQELLAEKQFKEGRRVTLIELAEATGISRVTLSKMVNQRGYGTLTDHLDKLCAFFGCRIEQLAEYIPDSEVVKKAGNDK
ncbi:helix-turn-helix domain-containing protein [Azonexus fungiphilus]|uniref:helix-turn-helix domain-containing protein n=1 Tax=Azonexus fungiphilus TaxID=146940 RepID=UPI00156B3593|nr:helix-turn-helix transcriptional regulator [Azonexus fungiphilus]NHC08363.1 helix-turn-helix transcriptional regulator [Azonexus fungiphilus]